MADTPFWQKTFDLFINIFIVSKQSLFLKKDNNAIEFNDNIVEECLKLLDGVTTMNPQTDKVSLYSKLSQYNGNEKLEVYSLLWHCYYIMYIMGPTSKQFLPKLRPTELSVKEKKDGIKLFIDEYASTKQIFSSEPIRPFRCLLHILKILWEKDSQDQTTDSIKTLIVEILLTKKEDYWKDKIEDFDERIKNILIYLCAPDQYLPIISQTHKKNIYDNLSFLLGSDNSNCEDKILEDKLKEIEKTLLTFDSQYSFYGNSIRPFWDTPTVSMNADKDGNLPLNTLLTFKKAIILYGPPGTSKTYTARDLAKSVICMEFAKKMKEGKKNKTGQEDQMFRDFLKKEKKIFGESGATEDDSSSQEVLSHIHRLQLHPNYSYDDFIVGKTIRNDNVDIQKGYLLNLIDNIYEDRTNQTSFADLPHIVILDEINRVDISRVFGELFTAMESEYRKDGIELPASIVTNNDGTKTNPLTLKVPMNLYFIGTMNMIDFSLEQVDFALRRRFAWVESTFDKDRLKVIINEKGNESSEVDNIDAFVSSCVALNNVIGNRLGEEYWIGHTFFAEIVDIRKETNLDLPKAKEFLWNISIKPMIEAYCGSMDNGGKKSFVQDCKIAFFPQSDNRQDETNA